MNVYTGIHSYYCGIDLHARTMYVCILDKDIVGHFPDPVVQLMIQTDLELIDHYDPIIKRLDAHILSLAKGHDPKSLHFLKSIKGVGDVLALTRLYEIHDIGR